MVSLGGITLSDHLVLGISAAAAAVNQLRLIGGALVVQTDLAIGGRILTMQSRRHMTVVQFDQIKALQEAGLPVTMVHHRGTFSVVITDTTGMQEDFYRADPDNDSTLTVSGSITMIEVDQ